MFPRVFTSATLAFYREQHIIRSTRPRTCEKHAAEWVRRRGERGHRQRGRLGDRRRRDQVAFGRRGRPPQIHDNYDVSTYYDKLWVTDDHPEYQPKIKNYKSLYHRRQAQKVARGALPKGPLDIRLHRDPEFVAEYAGTPGKRIDSFLHHMDMATLLIVGVKADSLVGPYRRPLAKKKLSYLLPLHGAPPATTFAFKFQGTYEECDQLLTKFCAVTLLEFGHSPPSSQTSPDTTPLCAWVEIASFQMSSYPSRLVPEVSTNPSSLRLLRPFCGC